MCIDTLHKGENDDDDDDDGDDNNTNNNTVYPRSSAERYTQILSKYAYADLKWKCLYLYAFVYNFLLMSF